MLIMIGIICLPMSILQAMHDAPVLPDALDMFGDRMLAAQEKAANEDLIHRHNQQLLDPVSRETLEEEQRQQQHLQKIHDLASQVSELDPGSDIMGTVLQQSVELLQPRARVSQKKTVEQMRNYIEEALKEKNPDYQTLKQEVEENKLKLPDSGKNSEGYIRVQQHNRMMSRLLEYIDRVNEHKNFADRQDLFTDYGKKKAEYVPDDWSLRELHDNKFIKDDITKMDSAEEEFAQAHNKEMDRRMKEMLKKSWSKYTFGFSKLPEGDQNVLAKAAREAYDKNPDAFDNGDTLTLARLLHESIDRDELSSKGKAFLEKQGRALMVAGVTGVGLLVLGVIALIKIFTKHEKGKATALKHTTTSKKSDSKKGSTGSATKSAGVKVKSHSTSHKPAVKSHEAHSTESTMAKDFKKAAQPVAHHTRVAHHTTDVHKVSHKVQAPTHHSATSKATHRAQRSTQRTRETITAPVQAPRHHSQVAPTDQNWNLSTGPMQMNPWGGSAYA